MAPVTPVEICEQVLKERKRYNEDHHIWPSENAIIDRLLARRIELRDVYEELVEKIGARSLYEFFDTLLGVGVVWTPDRIEKSRSDHENLIEINQQIGAVAGDLARLITKRDELHNRSAFHSDTLHDVCEIVAVAARDNHLFNGWVRESLGELRSGFDWKYWPTVVEFLEVLRSDALAATVSASDPITQVATAPLRHSKATFLSALFAAFKENKNDVFGLSDGTYASLMNCVLDLASHELVVAEYVKNFRQRERKRSKDQRSLN